MENNKLSEKEKQILNIMASFENEYYQKFQERQIIKLEYYQDFKIEAIKEIQMEMPPFRGIFHTVEKDKEGNISEHLYLKGASKEIFQIDSNGNSRMIPELDGFLGQMDIKQVIEKNEEGLKGTSKKIKNNEKEEKNPEVEDLELTNYREIKDNNLDEHLPGSFKGAEEKGIAFSKKLGAFVIVEKVNGKFQKSEEYKPSKLTLKSVISIDENGEKVERKVPHSLIETTNPKKELSVTIGQYGTIEVETVDRLPCEERVGMQLREAGEGRDGERTKQLRDFQKIEGENALHDLAHKYKKEEYEKGKHVNNVQDLEDKQRIYTEEEEELLKDVAKKEDMSVEDLKLELEQIPEEYTLEEKIQIVHEEKEKERQEEIEK